MEYVDIAIKSVISVIVTGAVGLAVAFFSFLFSLKNKLLDISNRLNENEAKVSVMLYTVGALFDKTFKGVENGRKEKAEQLLNDILYKFDK